MRFGWACKATATLGIVVIAASALPALGAESVESPQIAHRKGGAGFATNATTGDTAIPTDMVLIRAGTFQMGSPTDEAGRNCDEAQHEVTLTHDYFLSATEVTQGQWHTLMGTSPSYFSQCGDACPVERVSWFDAVMYANARSRAEGFAECYTLIECVGEPGSGSVSGDRAPLWGPGDSACGAWSELGPDCSGYRLPTESEWEHAAAATLSATQSDGLNTLAWYRDTAGARTHGAGTTSGDAAGLYDMLGNVWEWTNDEYRPYTLNVPQDPPDASGRSGHVVRGCSWGDAAPYCRVAFRNYFDPSFRSFAVGFRLARTKR